MCCEKEMDETKTDLVERLEKFYKRPIEEIHVEKIEEVTLGDPVGEEIW